MADDNTRRQGSAGPRPHARRGGARAREGRQGAASCVRSSRRAASPTARSAELLPLPDGDVVLFLSRLAEHQHFLAADPRRLDRRRAGDQRRARTRQGSAFPWSAGPGWSRTGPLMPTPTPRLHPDARGYINFPDFQFYRLHVAARPLHRRLRPDGLDEGREPVAAADPA